MFYCSIIKVPGLYLTFFTLTFLYQCYWLAVRVSDIYFITFALACQELFYFIFWSLSKNKILEIFLISYFRTNKKIYAFTLCFLSLFATAIYILQHLFDIVKNFFHLISLFSNETKLLFVVQSLNRDNRWNFITYSAPCQELFFIMKIKFFWIVPTKYAIY